MKRNATERGGAQPNPTQHNGTRHDPAQDQGANGMDQILSMIIRIMAAQGKPCIAYGADVGQMEPFLAKTARKLCRRTYFITRTEESLERLKALGLHGHAGTDTAWTFDRIAETCRGRKKRNRVTPESSGGIIQRGTGETVNGHLRGGLNEYHCISGIQRRK